MADEINAQIKQTEEKIAYYQDKLESLRSMLNVKLHVAEEAVCESCQ